MTDPQQPGQGEQPRKRRTKAEVMRDQVALAERLVALKRKELEDYTVRQRERRARIEAVEQSKAMLGGYLVSRIRANDNAAWLVFDAMERLGNERDKERYKRLRTILCEERDARSGTASTSEPQAR